MLRVFRHFRSISSLRMACISYCTSKVLKKKGSYFSPIVFLVLVPIAAWITRAYIIPSFACWRSRPIPFPWRHSHLPSRDVSLSLISNLCHLAGSMFHNTFQSGLLSVLYSIGSKPLQLWDKQVRDFEARIGRSMVCQVKNGHIKRITDEDIQSLIIEIIGANVRYECHSCTTLKALISAHASSHVQ